LLSTRVCLIVLLTALIPARRAEAQTTTALLLHSQPGDYIGQGLDRTYTAADATFEITTSTWNGAVRLSAIAPGLTFSWYLEFRAAGDLPLTVGTYEAAQRSAFTINHGLDVSGSGRGCNQLTGRFVVREIVRGPDNAVTQFAADFEQHCEDAAPALFGAIRYNSTISDLEPFEGAYPRYELDVTPAGNGRITGGGLDCGGGQTICAITLTGPTLVPIEAIPDAGHVFTGWSGGCRGARATTVHVNGPKLCSAHFEPEISSLPRTLLYWDSEPGDFIGGGSEKFLSPVNSLWTVTSAANGNRVQIGIQDGTSSWNLDFAAPTGQPLTVGTYNAARRYPFTSSNGLSISGAGRGCNDLTGRFVVLELSIASDGTVQRFAADFEQHCSDAVPGLFGAVRYQATVDSIVPFGGVYPVYQLDVLSPAHGRVTGSGLDCGAAGPLCQVPLSAAARLTLNAVPDVGYVFTGWAGDCRGGPTTTVHVNGPKTCTALFEPLVSSAPRTLLFWDARPGTAAAWQAVYSPGNSRWSVTSSGNGNRIHVAIDDGWWSSRYIDFSAPTGQPLAVGYYGAARRYPFTSFHGLSSSGCNQLTGRFVVLEIAVAADGTVQRFAADFEEHCNDEVPATFGAVRYNATVDEVAPFGGVYPTYQLTVTPSAAGVVRAPGLECGAGASQCSVAAAMAAQITLTATPRFGYTFMGWSEDCSGGPVTLLHLNGPKRCAARFEPTVPESPRTVLRWDSHPGNYLGAGRSEVYARHNSRWAMNPLQNGNGVQARVQGRGPLSDPDWTLEFRAPVGQILQVGAYTGADDFPTASAPMLAIFGEGRYCGGGSFTVRQLVTGAQNAVLRFAVDFTLTCSSPSSPLTGSLHYEATVDVPPTTLSVDRTAIVFSTLHNGSTILAQPTPQTVRVTLSRPTVGWTAAASQSWIQVLPAAGTGSAELTVSLNVLGGHPGTGGGLGSVTITLTDGSGTAQTVNVALVLRLIGTTAAPFGVIDTPAPTTSGVTGAVPMTGWALDDIEVTAVKICRAPVGPERPPFDINCGLAAQIFVGDAVFIEGSRPDVQSAFPVHPRNNLGGWGFMVLTNTLPNQGNGTFTFYAYARDREGLFSLLGTRTMTCDNAHANAPFGTIDTPGQGDTVGGSSYVNFGWALTQNPKHLAADGSTLMVYVDGVPIGTPSYGHPRADIAAIFPGLANSDGAVGFKIIDTTALTNGLHTIVWTATDSAGMTSGLGSRFFRVANGVASAAAMTSALSSSTLEAVPLDPTPVVARRGWAADAPWRSYAVGAAGRAVLRGEEIDRFELALAPPAGETYAGYLRVGAEFQPLPVGSRLDPDSGAFTWSPGVGFVGRYDLVFVRSAGARAVARRDVRILLAAKGSGHVGPQVVIDTPRSQQDVAQPFALGGWAADLDAAAGPGIDTLHVWAYPLTGGPPVFLGTPELGGPRPDVAAIHGDQFLASGFGLVVQGLPHGHYDLAVFPWSGVTGGFAAPQIVRITAR
jgi:Divergent InlB B-repeat domain